MRKDIFGSLAQIEQFLLFSKLKKSVDVSFDLLFFIGKAFGKISDKPLFSFGQAISHVFIDKAHFIIGVFVSRTQFYLVHNTQIIKYFVKVATFLKTAKDVHSRRKTHTVPLEGLQASTNDGVLFQYGHLVAFLSQQGSCNQAANSSSYDDTTFHFRKVWVSITQSHSGTSVSLLTKCKLLGI